MLKALRQLGKKIPKKEIKMPEPWECCGDSCPNCVWTIYFEEISKSSSASHSCDT